MFDHDNLGSLWLIVMGVILVVCLMLSNDGFEDLGQPVSVEEFQCSFSGSEKASSVSNRHQVPCLSPEARFFRSRI